MLFKKNFKWGGKKKKISTEWCSGMGSRAWPTGPSAGGRFDKQMCYLMDLLWGGG